MAKLKEEEIKKLLMTDFAEHLEWEGRGAIKVRIYDIDKFVKLVMKSYQKGIEDGEDKFRRKVIKLMQSNI